jgi:multidrug efflux pump
MLVSLIGTFAVMRLLDYSLDNLSLMALTVASGFVIDDAIVMVENVSRHIEAGVPRIEAAIRGSGEVAFSMIAMSFSLVAIFVPMLLMGGMLGRLFREFAVTLSVTMAISLGVSLTTTPMMCALTLRRTPRSGHGRFYRIIERFTAAMLRGYDRTLTWVLNHPRLVLNILLATILINFYLYMIVPKGFLPHQDTGRISGSIQADQSISFQLMRQKLQQVSHIIERDSAVDFVAGFTGGGEINSGFVFISLKPLTERQVSTDQVISRLRGAVGQIPGVTLFLQAAQDIRISGRAANAQYQFILQAAADD